MALRLVTMGTGRFALPTFRALYDSPHEVVGLFTQPDRKGRGHHRHPHPARELAESHGTPVFQPEDAGTDAAISDLRSLQPDVCVVAAYGQILKPGLLEVPRLGAINLHASLLPKYRGAAPIQYAVWNGESETGVTIFRIEPRLDAGPILGTVRTPIRPKETAGALEQRLSELAVPLTLEVLEQMEAGRTREQPQDAAGVTKAPRLKKSDGLIDWSRPATVVECQVRAVQPWPKPTSFLVRPAGEPQRLLVLDVEPVQPVAGSEATQAEPGTIVEADDERIVVATGEGCVALRSVQPEGKRAMTAREFLQGHPVAVGDRFVSTT